MENQKTEQTTSNNSFKKGIKMEIYQRIWNALNQTSLEIIEQESSQYPTQIDDRVIAQYFKRTSHYKIVNLTSLNDEDKLYIENSGLSLSYLNQNKKLVTTEGISEEKTVGKDHLLHQQLTAKEGCLYAICPSTGQLLKSSHSILVNGLVFYYRFVGNEVFYVIVAGNRFQKDALYFPRLELIIYLKPYKELSVNVRNLEIRKQGMTPLKVTLLKHWKILKQYLSDVRPKEKVAVVGVNFSIWHHLINELSGVLKIYESGFLQEIDKFLVIGPEYFGGIDEIFSEIPSDKVQRLHYWRATESTSWKTRSLVHANASSEILKNNFFVFKLGDDDQVSDNLQHRIYSASLRKCSSNFLAKVERAKKKHFPLFWVSFRTHHRSWISQVEGIANIVNCLSDNFPDLAVIFDGYTRIDVNGDLLIVQQDENLIRDEERVLSQIQSLFSSDIKVYNNIGSPMYEVVIWANAIDLCLIPGGSTTAKMKKLVCKPGVRHSNLTLGSNLPENTIVDMPQNDENSPLNYSYDFDWKIAYAELLKIASSINREQ